jgi:hypothetical protein
MPNKTRNRGNPRRRRGQGNSSSNNVRSIAASLHTGPADRRVSNPADYGRRPPNLMITQSPPRNLRNQIYWFQKTITLKNAISISSSTVTEVNFSFLFTDIPEYTTLYTLFDLFCLHSVIVHIAVDTNTISTGASFGRLTTAIDYDNVANIASEPAIQEFSSAQTVDLSANLTIERMVMPCVDPYLFGAYYSSQRMWVDSASYGVQHYGFRSLWAQNAFSGLTADYVCTYIFGFRNSI